MREAIGVVFSVLIRPKQVFERAGGLSTLAWALAALILSIAMLGRAFLTLPAQQAQATKQIRAQLVAMEKDAASGKTPPLPPEVKADMKRSAQPEAPAGQLLVGNVLQVAWLWLGLALSGLVITGLTKILGGKISYKTALVVLGLAFMPFVVGELIKTAATLATGSASLNEGMSSLVAGSNGTVPMGVGSILLFATLSRIDVFVIWSLVLLAVGVATVGGVSKSKGALVAGLYWVISWALVMAPTVVGAVLMPVASRGGPVVGG